MKKNPIIGITSTYLEDGVYVHKHYHQSVMEMGGIPVVIPIAEKEMIDQYIKMCDGFILSGGEDVDPLFYNEHPQEKLGIVHSERDEFELALVEKIIKKDKPLLAICRGLQVLNVALEGTLVQDIPSQLDVFIQHFQKSPRDKTIHVIDVEEDTKLYDAIQDTTYKVNSLHHQCIGVLGNGLIPTAFAADEVVEAVEHESARYIVGVQWNPESMANGSKEMKKLFKQLVDASKNK